MRVYHPNAVRDTDDSVDGAVDVGGEVVAVENDDTLELSDTQAERLADRYGVDVSDIQVEESADEPSADAESDEDVAAQIDAGECPWCDDYEGQHVGQHASSAHPNEWAAFKD